MTNDAGGEATSGYANAPQNVGSAFTANFTYTTNGGADGAAFVLQNDARGTAALGGTGGFRGYGDPNTPVMPSAAFEFATFNNTGNYPGAIGFNTNGNTNTPNPLANTGIDLSTGHPVNVTLSYIASLGQLQERLVDTTTNRSYTHTDTGVNLATTLGKPTALVGFSAATGGITSTQTVSNFNFAAGAATIATTSYAPIAFSGGFNNALVVPAIASNQSKVQTIGYITATMDRGPNISLIDGTGDTWFERGFVNSATNTPSDPTAGLPTSGSTFTSQADALHTFQVQPYSDGTADSTPVNDAVLLNNGAVIGSAPVTSTLALSTPTAYSALSLLLATGNAGPGGMFDLTANYLNGTSSDLGVVVSPDWFGSGTIAYASRGRYDVQNAAYDLHGNGQPDLFQVDVPLTDTTDPIVSLTLTDRDGTNNGAETAIFAVSGGTVTTTTVTPTAVPEPATLGLFAVAAAGLVARRRRR